MTATATYFRNFFDEKEIPFASWDIEFEGNTHVIDSEFVIELVKGTRGTEAKALVEMLTRIDFANAPVLPYLEHLANGYIRSGAWQS